MNRIAKIFEEYDLQGIHRTGTEVDQNNADWLAERVSTIGEQPLKVGFPHLRIDPVRADLQIGDRKVEGLPFFDCAFTGPEGITGQLGTLADEAPIAVSELSPRSPGGALIKVRRQGKFKAIVAVCHPSEFGNIPGISPVNAEDFTTPFGPPVLQISSEAEAWLTETVASGQKARVRIQVERTPVTAFNLEVRVKGTDATLPPIVIITPRSGWWHSTSERGGGIACWLELLRALSEQGSRRDVWFVATTGHELGHLGLEHFLEEHPELIQKAYTWIHLGANFAAVGPSVRLQTSNPEFQTRALEAIRKRNPSLEIETRSELRPYGEARSIFDGGGRYISLLGPNGLFHHPDDRWPTAVDIPKAAGLIHAITEIVTELSQN